MSNRKRPDIEPCGTSNMISQDAMHALVTWVFFVSVIKNQIHKQQV